MSNYNRGANFERRVKRALENKGAFVIRSAGSRSPVDLVAFWSGEICFLQVKVDGNLSKGERELLTYLAQENRCRACMAYRDKKKIIFEDLQR